MKKNWGLMGILILILVVMLSCELPLDVSPLATTDKATEDEVLIDTDGDGIPDSPVPDGPLYEIQYTFSGQDNAVNVQLLNMMIDTSGKLYLHYSGIGPSRIDKVTPTASGIDLTNTIWSITPNVDYIDNFNYSSYHDCIFYAANDNTYKIDAGTGTTSGPWSSVSVNCTGIVSNPGNGFYFSLGDTDSTVIYFNEMNAFLNSWQIDNSKQGYAIRHSQTAPAGRFMTAIGSSGDHYLALNDIGNVCNTYHMPDLMDFWIENDKVYVLNYSSDGSTEWLDVYSINYTNNTLALIHHINFPMEDVDEVRRVLYDPSLDMVYILCHTLGIKKFVALKIL